MSDVRNKRHVALAKKSGKPLHISSLSKILSDIRAEAATAAANAAQTAACNPPKKEKQTAVKPKPAAPASRRRPAITRMLSGSDWARHAAVTIDQKQLCGPLWYEGEICILFADTNVGKSILAVQIADMVANGMHCTTTLPELRPETLSQPVVYADFELSLVQFGRRYSCPHPDEPGRKVYYDFSQQFNRVELCYDMSSDDFTDDYATQAFADQVISDLEMRIEEAMARVLIIDNITFMASGTESAADAMPLMKKLVALKKRHDLSILLLAHTPKRALCNPLTRNDLQGSKMLINFADSAFAIGESNRGKDLRYIKQIKQRNCEQVYDRDNVLSCTIGKIYENFVGFSSIGTDSEDSHLAERQRFSRSRTDMRKVADEMKTSGKSIDEIASTLGVSRSTTFRLLRKSEEECDPTP